MSAYREVPASVGVESAAVCTWEGHGGWERRLRVLPDGCADLVWDGSRLAVVGASVGPVWHPLRGDAHNLGLRLQPGAAGPILGWPAYELPGDGVALDALWGSAARRWEDRLGLAGGVAAQRRLLESLVASRIRAGHEQDRLVTAAYRRLSTAASVDAVARALAVSGRELRRRFQQDVGYGPKALQRVLRFQRFVRRIGAVASGRVMLAALAAELGYADQSHLSRECLELSGSSPRSLIAHWSRRGSWSEIVKTGTGPHRHAAGRG